MKILFITHYGAMYGANRSMLKLIDLLKSTHNVEVLVLCTSGGEIYAEAKKHNINVIRVRYYPWMVEKQNSNRIKEHIKMMLNHYVLLHHIINLARDFSPDIIHTNSSVTDLGRNLSKVLCIPDVWHLREFGWEDYRLTYNFSTKHVANEYAHSSQLIAISNAIRKKFYNISPNSNILVIPNGVDLKTDFHRRGKLSSDINFVQVGKLSVEKNQITVLKAVRKLINRGIRNFKVSFVGDGTTAATDELLEYSNKYDLQPFVEFLGFRDDVSEIIQSADIGLMPSLQEAFGRVTVEYMLAGLPVIGANTGGTPEIIDSESGRLFDPINANQLAELMQNFILNPDEIRRIGKNAKAHARASYTAEKNAESIYKVYMRLIGGNADADSEF